MTTYRRRLAVPDGCYAVYDPDGNLTYWWVVAGAWSDYPPDARWRPLPPRAERRLDKAEHRQRIAEWYATAYADWCGHIAAAIEADPEAARQRFVARYGERQPPPPPRKKPQRRSRTLDAAARRGVRQAQAERARRQQEDMAVVLRLAGLSYRRIAKMLDCSLKTAWRRAARARNPVLAGDYLPLDGSFYAESTPEPKP